MRETVFRECGCCWDKGGEIVGNSSLLIIIITSCALERHRVSYGKCFGEFSISSFRTVRIRNGSTSTEGKRLSISVQYNYNY